LWEKIPVEKVKNMIVLPKKNVEKTENRSSKDLVAIQAL
jgi:hypothetical protein